MLDIAHAARAVVSFIEGMDETAFRGDMKTQAAVQHQIMIIGEASKRLTSAFREAHPDIPWNAIARMRDRLIHGYGTVDLGVVWRTASEAIPGLLRVLEDR
ncbi:MAG TPA: DUF86 domain-containing protein [Candidatus Hydrogenedentes bacterium]|nr:DUF86 domain-containing protein [Candidatus Hydrogenedentota bacterium]